MTYDDFLGLVPATPDVLRCSEATLQLWHHIYEYIVEHHYADTADSPEFVAHVATLRPLSAASINAHLRRMAKARIIKKNRLKRVLPAELKEEFFNPAMDFFSGSMVLPATFVRYCLPDRPCSMEFKAVQRKVERNIQRGRQLLEDMKNHPFTWGGPAPSPHPVGGQGHG